MTDKTATKPARCFARMPAEEDVPAAAIFCARNRIDRLPGLRRRKSRRTAPKSEPGWSVFRQPYQCLNYMVRTVGLEPTRAKLRGF